MNPAYEINPEYKVPSFTDGEYGAILCPTTGKWIPFNIKDSGELDLWPLHRADTPVESYKKATQIFT